MAPGLAVRAIVSVGFLRPADIKCDQGKLKADYSERLDMPAPCNPQGVADQRTYETRVPPALRLIGQQPDREDVDNHSGPLQ